MKEMEERENEGSGGGGRRGGGHVFLSSLKLMVPSV